MELTGFPVYHHPPYSNNVGRLDPAYFPEQLKNFAQCGDVVMAISGSGNSP